MILDELLVLPTDYAARYKERELKAKGFNIRVVSYCNGDIGPIVGLRAKRITVIRPTDMTHAAYDRFGEYMRRLQHCLTPDGVIID